jgi:hypothetical protein
MSKRGAQLALGSHGSEPPLLKQKTDETVVFPDEVLAVILKMVVLEQQPGLAQPVRLVCHRWNALMEAHRREWQDEASRLYPDYFEAASVRAAEMGFASLVTYYLDMPGDTREMPQFYCCITLSAAAGTGHLSVMRLVKKRYRGSLEDAVCTAAALGQTGPLELLKADMSKSLRATALRKAISGIIQESSFYISRGVEGRMEVIRLMRESGVQWNFYDAIHRCVAAGDAPMVRAIWRNEGPSRVIKGLLRTAGGAGSVEVLAFLKEEMYAGATPNEFDLWDGMHHACHGDHLAAMHFFKEWGAPAEHHHADCGDVLKDGPAYNLMRSWLE